MGATFSVVLYGRERQRWMLRLTLRSPRLRGSMHCSPTTAESEWSEVNRRAAEELVRVSPELFQCCRSGMATSRGAKGLRHCGGAANEAVGLLQGIGPPAQRAEVDSVMPSVGWRTYIWTRRTGRCGSTAREWSWIRGIARDTRGLHGGRTAAAGISDCFCGGSESTMVGMGTLPRSRRAGEWDQGPAQPRRTVDEVFLKDASLSTSAARRSSSARREASTPHHGPRTGFRRMRADRYP